MATAGLTTDESKERFCQYLILCERFGSRSDPECKIKLTITEQIFLSDDCTISTKWIVSGPESGLDHLKQKYLEKIETVFVCMPAVICEVWLKPFAENRKTWEQQSVVQQRLLSQHAVDSIFQTKPKSSASLPDEA
jgi:hypothetical protein